MGYILRSEDFPNQSTLTPEQLEAERLRLEQELGSVDLPSLQADNAARIMQEQQPEPIAPEVAEEEPQIELPRAKKVAASEPVEALRTENVVAPEPVKPVEKAPDETEQLMSEYRKSRDQYQSDVDKFDQDREASEASRQRMTGIAGALSAFGEGLAAITGGSAKPLQAGVAAVKGMGEQQAASEERKAKTLKERLQMAKAPLEEKQTEIDLRSRLSKGKMEQDLMDPASQQSAQARKDAGAFIDNMIAQGTANRASPDVMQRLEQTKSLIGQMSAAQVQQFYNTLKPLSTETSVEAKNKFDMDKLAAQESMKLKLAEAKDSKDQEKVAKKELIKDQSAISTVIKEASGVAGEMKAFKEDLALAVKGDKEAAKRVTQKSNIINYLNARSYESKGVFTDKDATALSELAATKWFDQFNDWASKGGVGVLPMAGLIRMNEIIQRSASRFDNPTKYVYQGLVEKYKGLDEVDKTGVWKPALTLFQKKAGETDQPPSATGPEDEVAKYNRLQKQFGNKVPSGGQ